MDSKICRYKTLCALVRSLSANYDGTCCTLPLKVLLPLREELNCLFPYTDLIHVRLHQFALVLLLQKCWAEEDKVTSFTPLLLPVIPQHPALLSPWLPLQLPPVGYRHLPDTCPNHSTTACHASAKMWSGRVACDIFQSVCVAKTCMECLGPQSDQATKILKEFT